MANTRRWAIGATVAAAIVLLVRVLDGSVDHIGHAVSVVLRGDLPNLDLLAATPPGLPRWLLLLDNLVAATLLAFAFFGGVPLGLFGLALSRATQPVGRRFIVALGAVWPAALVLQVSGLLLAALISLLGLLMAGWEYAREPWAWYQALSVAVGAAAIPWWRRVIGRSSEGDTRLGLARQPA